MAESFLLHSNTLSDPAKERGNVRRERPHHGLRNSEKAVNTELGNDKFITANFRTVQSDHKSFKGPGQRQKGNCEKANLQHTGKGSPTFRTSHWSFLNICLKKLEF